jgi:hypothetical protein
MELSYQNSSQKGEVFNISRWLEDPADRTQDLGVAALIPPWNFRIGMSARKVRFLTSPVCEKNLLSLPRKTLLTAHET